MVRRSSKVYSQLLIYFLKSENANEKNTFNSRLDCTLMICEKIFQRYFFVQQSKQQDGMQNCETIHVLYNNK